jgi:hypothetical protein
MVPVQLIEPVEAGRSVTLGRAAAEEPDHPRIRHLLRAATGLRLQSLR